jgi:hypothetical protein
VTREIAAPQNEISHAADGGSSIWPRRSQRLTANSTSTTTLPPPCSAPMLLARVPLGMASQSMVPNGAATRPPISPAAMSAKATVPA